MSTGHLHRTEKHSSRSRLSLFISPLDGDELEASCSRKILTGDQQYGRPLPEASDSGVCLKHLHSSQLCVWLAPEAELG